MANAQKIENYAKLVVEVGVNIQKGQDLFITCPISVAYFARLLTKQAYLRGAKKVYVDYVDEELTKVTYTYAPDEAFLEYPSWMAKGKEELAKKNAAFISISASNPDLLKDIDPTKIATQQKTAGLALMPWRDYMQRGEVAWCVVSIPTVEWSRKVFEDAKTDEEALEKLWEKIFVATRMDEENPVAAWQEHVEELEKRTQALNEKRIKTLHYTGPMTDLTVTLPEGHLWDGGGSYTTKGTFYVANMPTEEVFTMPFKYGVNGKIAATKPLNYGGNLIEDFVLYFKDGKVVDYTAKAGLETLKGLIETDEGSAYLGEVAIVPQNSPVSNTQVLFYNTLFDENASCHFALGSAYPETLKDGTKMTKEALEKAGANTSITHVDFMVGSKDLTIEAETHSGEKFFVLKDGEWGF